MKFLEFIRITKNNNPEEMEVVTPAYFEDIDLAHVLYENYEIYCNELFWDDYIYRVLIDSSANQIKAMLRGMRVRMLQPIGSIKKIRNILFSHISLLFGLCSSQSSLILNAFFGNSLSRIPAL